MKSQQDSNELLIYGYGKQAREFIRIARQYGFTIKAVYHENSLVAFMHGINKSKFQHLAKSTQLPIVITNLSQDYSKFSNDIQHIRNVLELNNHLLHPVFLCDYYISTHTRYHLRGFPGSGNMVFQDIMDKIVRSDNFVNKTPIDPNHCLMERYALWYWYSLTNNFEKLFDKHDIESTICTPKYMRTASFAMTLKGKDPGVPQFDGLPCRSYVWSNPWGGDHSPLTQESIDFFKSQNFINIQILRHPLDILISNANKAVITTNYTQNDIINNENWFKEILGQITKYFMLIVKHKKDVHIVKYEYFLGNSVSMVQQFSTILGTTLSKVECKQIWKSVNGKKLTSYWKPGNNKWKEYIPKRYRMIIEESGIIQLANDLGYQIDLNELKSEAESDIKKNQLNDLDLYRLAVRDVLDHRSNVGKRITFKHQNIIAREIKGTNIHVTCVKTDFDKIGSFIKSDLNKNMLKAAFLKPYYQSLDAYHYFRNFKRP